MSAEELAREAMELSLAERVLLAQSLWESIDAGLPDSDDTTALQEAVRRDEELSAGTSSARTHHEVMQAARRALGCG